MNAKRAKHLRHQARQLTIGAPDVEYETVTVKTPGMNPKGLPKELIRLTPQCTKGMYRVLKRLERRKLRRLPQ